MSLNNPHDRHGVTSEGFEFWSKHRGWLLGQIASKRIELDALYDELRIAYERMSEAAAKDLQAGASTPDCPNTGTVISTSPDPTEPGKRGE
jgi:hypothetical protein